ncbi:hypothetical protein ACFLS1_05045 [Verrucomicrobiota bacterium]
MNQILLGVSFPFVAALIVYAIRRGRTSVRILILVPVCMTISALWAIAPDIPRLLGFSDLYNRLASDPRCDIFFWHYSIDLMEINSPWYTAGFVLILLCLLTAAWRELYLREKGL